MDFLLNLINSNWYTFLIIPFLIFIARILDVSIGTIRVIFISKGFKFLAAFLGFFEVLIWLAALQQLMLNLTNIYCYLAYALGFATGTYIGIFIENKISMGKVMIRIITKKDSNELLKNLKDKTHITTTVGATGHDGKVKVIISIIKRKDISKIIETAKNYDENAFFSIEDIKYPLEKDYSLISKSKIKNFFGKYRKAK